jgi:L-seryl-tRNA(Ser) seleniumtransferase
MDRPFRNLPSVDALLKRAPVAQLVSRFGRDIVVHAVREVVADFRRRIQEGKAAFSEDGIERAIGMYLLGIQGTSLKQMVNATGIVLHTNLGRAVLGKKILSDITPVVTGYSTVEFDCASASRGNRHAHIAPLLRYLTGAEDVLVVNNNAAGIILALSTLAPGREVVVSRGELIEIGGEFRIPDIMAASGACMKEVGTTNRTRLSDYESAITEKTACVFKAHKSNYTMSGFVEESPVKELAALCRKRGLFLIYDIGSGLLRKPEGLPLDREPDVAGSLSEGADLVLFSGDKLLGGPQAGIIAGKRDLVKRLARAPLMRALRVGKLTLAALSSACRLYLDDAELLSGNPTFRMLSRKEHDILGSARRLHDLLESRSIASSIVETEGQCGGGTLPDVRLKSHAVKVTASGSTGIERSRFSEKIFGRLLLLDRPVLGVLREGELLFDMRTVEDEAVDYCAGAIERAIKDETVTREGKPS